MDNSERCKLIETYFHMGFSYSEIVNCLRHLKRLLHKYNLQRKETFSDIFEVAAFIQNELSGSGSLNGYRWMHLKCLQNNLVVTRETVRLLLHAFDPKGVEMRRKHRLQRRQYFNKGPNYLWHMDGYDKLKPYGICISGCCDGFSRYILWLNAFSSNNDPRLIAGYFITTVQEVNGCPRAVRADHGTENGHVQAMQIMLRTHNNSSLETERSCFIYGRSTANQRIESRANSQFWMNTFESLKNDGFYTAGFLDKELIRFCFMELIQVYFFRYFKRDLDKVARIWNCHKIRQTKNAIAPSGRPFVMFSTPHLYNGLDYLHFADPVVIEACKAECRFRDQMVCNVDVFELVSMIMDDDNIAEPNDVQSAVKLYLYLRQKMLHLLQ